MRGSVAESQRSQKQRRFDNDGEGSDEYIKLFRKERGISTVQQLLELSAKCGNRAVEGRGSFFLASSG